MSRDTDDPPMQRRRVALLVLLALLSGCGKMEKGSRPAEKPADRATSGEAAAALPADFPKDVPVLKGAMLKLAISQPDKTIVHLQTTSSIADAAKYYDAELKNQGWRIESETRSGDMYTVSARKGKTVCGVTITREAKGTLIRMAVSQNHS
jgi:hypothetical protein